MTPIKNSVRLTAVVVSAIYSAVLFLSEIELDSWEKRILAALPTVGAAAVVLFDRWIWAWRGVRELHHRPRLQGLWRVSATPHRDSHIPKEGNWSPSGFIVIEQTFWTISIRQYTPESKSYSRTATFLKHGETSQQTLSFLYDNDPRPEHRDRSPRHVGACELATPQGQPTHLEGTYFTDRFTQGEMTLDFVDDSINFADYKSAKTYADSRP